ncbi:MAG: hypothetical protein SRB2_01618 [Desulfobacteraceae bacterium Eth-SRB2]|nr:MAG: hypothetical protein SRB2_01618 [Desulfobacteraceae bacterium Eth-SRB2]
MPKKKFGTLTKADIISTLTNHLGFTKKKATDTTETLLELIKKTQNLNSGVKNAANFTPYPLYISPE